LLSGANIDLGDLAIGQVAPPLPGDFNADGTVGAADYVVWRNTVGQAVAGLAADGDGDRIDDTDDYGVWRSNFGIPAEPAVGRRKPRPSSSACRRRRPAQ
jgi:hypothetical protein